MEKKAKIESGKKEAGVKVVIDGLDDVFLSLADSEALIGKYERFSEHVLLSCAMPEIPRLVVHDETIEGTIIPDAFSALSTLLVRYRKMTNWLRNNGIDPESVVGDGNDKKSKS